MVIMLYALKIFSEVKIFLTREAGRASRMFFLPAMLYHLTCVMLHLIDVGISERYEVVHLRSRITIEVPIALIVLADVLIC